MSRTSNDPSPDQAAFARRYVAAVPEAHLPRQTPLTRPEDWDAATAVRAAAPREQVDQPPSSGPPASILSPGFYHITAQAPSFAIFPPSWDDFSPTPLLQHQGFTPPTGALFEQNLGGWGVEDFAGYGPTQVSHAGECRGIGDASVGTFSPALHLPLPEELLPRCLPSPNPSQACPASPPTSLSDSDNRAPVDQIQEGGHLEWNGDSSLPANHGNHSSSPAGECGQTRPAPPVSPAALSQQPSAVSVANCDGKDTGDPKPTKRDRSRMAAARYRSNTRRTAAHLETENRHNQKKLQRLRATVGQLRNEVLELETKILTQSGCSCALMRGYVSAKAQRYLASIAEGGHRAVVGGGQQEMAAGREGLMVPAAQDVGYLFISGQLPARNPSDSAGMNWNC